MSACHISFAIRTHCQHQRFEESRTDENQTVTEDRTRHIGESLAVAHRPDLFAGSRIIRCSPVRTGTDHLCASSSLNHQRRCVSLVSLDRKSTRLNSRSPCNLVCRLLLEKK